MNVKASIWVDNDEDTATVAMVRGGIKIEVNSRRINQYKNEEHRDWVFEWNPEYIGEHIRSDIVNLVTAVREIQQGEVDIYEPTKVDIEAINSYFLLEPLSGDLLRIAFRTDVGLDDTEEYQPSPAAERGYVVKTDELAHEILQIGREFLGQTRQMGFDVSDSPLYAFSTILDEFESQLE